MIIHRDIIQKTPEWYRIRSGKMTGSGAQAIGNNGKGLDTLIYNTVADYFAIKDTGDNYISGDMKRGNELEPEARKAYEEIMGTIVDEVGFIESDEFTGCSPDGLVGEDGLIEIKCPNNAKFFNHILEGINAIDSAYIWQCQFNLLITGRQWVDYVCYNPSFETNLWVQRIYPDANMQAKIKLGIQSGTEKIKELINKYNQKTNGTKV